MDFKGFMEKMKPSSSGKFKGQGRVLGSGSSSSSGPSSGSVYVNPNRNPNPPSVSSNSKALPLKTSSNPKTLPEKSPSEDPTARRPTPNRETSNSNLNANSNSDGFDPFDSLITSGKRNKNGYSLKVFECPVCNSGFTSEEEVSLHIESCIENPTPRKDNGDGFDPDSDPGQTRNEPEEPTDRLETCVGTYLSGNPSESSVEIVLRLLRNIVKEPENVKFRKIRMGNPKIREAIGEVPGGIELVESVGFALKEEGGEMWAVMEDDPVSQNAIVTLQKAIRLLEPRKTAQPQKIIQSEPRKNGGPQKTIEPEPQKITEPEPRKTESDPEKFESELEKIEPAAGIDRQTRVFFAVSERVAARIELPESFYSLSYEEARREAENRRKKMADSQLLIPKSYKEKQAQAVRRKYTRAIIRVQFPDSVVLQGVFCPGEPTSALYEFVSSALKQPGLEFELVHPVPVRRRVIPCFPVAAGERQPTLADEDLVPSVLVKFKPIETDDVVFFGLSNELLLMSEPLEGADT